MNWLLFDLAELKSDVETGMYLILVSHKDMV
jgi:hypothetical protein